MSYAYVEETDAVRTVELALTVLSVVLVGIVSFLYNDGHDHKIVAGVAGAVGWCGTAITRAVGTWPAPKPCKAHYVPDGQDLLSRVHYDCRKSPGLLRIFFDAFVWPGIKELAFLIAAGLAGLLLAKVTPRRPADGRKAKICFDDL